MTKKQCPLGEACDLTTAWMAGAAKAQDQIKAQAAEIERLNTQCEGLFQAAMNNGQALIIAESKLAKALKELEWQASQPEAHPFMAQHARTTLAELTGGKDE